MSFYKIKSISVKGLYGCKNFHIDFDENEKIAIIFGENGAGKTTLIKILDCLLNFNKSKLEKFNDFYYLYELNFNEVNIYLSNNESAIELSKRIERFHPQNDPDGEQEEDSEDTFLEISFTNNKFEFSKPGDNINAFVKKIDEWKKKLNEFFGVQSIIALKTNRAFYGKKKLDVSKDGIAIDFSSDRIKECKERIKHLNKDFNEEFKIFNDILNKICDNFKIYIKNNSLKVYLHSNNDNQYVELKSLSSGEINILNILFVIIIEANDNSIIFIDEPELSLHLKWQVNIVKIILNFIKGRNIQIIFASHSPFISNCYPKLLTRINKNDN